MMRSLSPEQGDQGAGGQADRQLDCGGGVGHGELLLLAPDDDTVQYSTVQYSTVQYSSTVQ